MLIGLDLNHYKSWRILNGIFGYKVTAVLPDRAENLSWETILLYIVLELAGGE